MTETEADIPSPTSTIAAILLTLAYLPNFKIFDKKSSASGQYEFDFYVIKIC